MRNLWVDGKCLREFSLYVSGENGFDASQWQYSRKEVPGRNGDLIIPSKRLANVTVQYPAAITKNFSANAAALRQYLLSAGAAYRRIEDDYNVDTYRLGIFSGPMSFETGFLNRTGEITLEFDCKPQRYIKQGEFSIAVHSGHTISNQWMPALPLLQITGTGDGQLVVGSSQVDITGMTGAITLDCDVQNAYNGTLNLNNNITITGGWPVLATGQTAISFSGGITAVSIVPRWWTL